MINNNFLSINDYLIFQEKQKKNKEDYRKEIENNTEDNSREIEGEDIWDSLNGEEKIQFDADRWTDGILNETEKRERERLDEENNKRNLRERYENDFNNSIITKESIFFLG